MKKAKTFLAALIVITIVGGALAFKVKVPSLFAYCDTIFGSCILSPFYTFASTTNFGQKAPFDEYGAPCKLDIGPAGVYYTCYTYTMLE